MRLKLSLAVLGLLMAGTAPSLAQNPQTQQGYYPVQPIYNTNTAVPYFQSQNGASPNYNNGTNAPAFPMQQMIAGKNAPSYNYNTTGGPQPYNNFGNNNPANGPTPMDQIQGGSYQRDLAGLAYQQQYMQDYQKMLAQQQSQLQQQQQQPQNAPSAYQGNAFSQLYANAAGPDKPAAPKKQRVVYKERNNPLIVPPRLFNPDE